MPEELLQGLLTQLVSHHPLLRLEAAAQLGRLADPRAVPALVDRLADSDSEVRASVVQALASIRGREVAARLVPLLSVEQVGLRNAAMDLLRRMGQDAPDLILALLEEDDRDLRIFAADIVGNVDSPGVSRALIRALADLDPNVRATAAISLGRRRESLAVPALIKALSDEQWVRFAAIEALAAIGDTQALEPLLAVMREDDELAQASIAAALGSFVDPRAADCLLQALESARGALVPLLVNALLKTATQDFIATLDPVLRERVVLGLVDSLEDPSDQVRADALKGLARMGETGAVYAILNLARRNQDPEVAGLILRALVAIGAPGPLMGAAGDHDPRVAEVAVAALGSLGGQDAAQALVKALEHPSSKVRRQAAQHLGALGCHQAVPCLEMALQDQDPRVQRESAQALGLLGQARSVASLGALLDHPRLELRLEVLRALLAVNGEEVRSLFLRGLESHQPRRRELCALGLGALGLGGETRRLVALLADPEPRVRRAAVQSLVESGAPTVWLALGRVLEDQDRGVRLALVQAMEARNLPEVRELLVRALDDPDPQLRHQAVESLGRMGAVEAVRPLVGLLQGPDRSLRIAAARSLGDIGAEEASADLIGLLADPDPEVRATATRSLQLISGGWG
ncbi:MAG: HEAT repeat domain-containing protein [Pseudomonadota bacterium]